MDMSYMKNSTFQRTLQTYLKAPGVKKAWISENQSPNPNDCQSCGGASYIYIFVATGGPFNTPGCGPHIISKWHDGKFWVGQTYAITCPTCAGKIAPRLSPAVRDE
jgi:hypothetical protein